MKSLPENKADHLLYKVYWKLVLSDILTQQGFPDTAEAKKLLHGFHKRILGYKSIAEESQEVVSTFIQKVTLLWAEYGVFVRTSRKQPPFLQNYDLADVWHLL